LQTLLDEELGRLPDRYRLPIVLCDLEGKTLKEAAGQLAWPRGTVATRLTRGRGMLAKRLTGRGLTLTGSGLAAVLSPAAASAGMPAGLILATVRAASAFAAAQTEAAGAVSTTVAALTEGVLKAMLLSRLKIATALGLLLAVLGLGAPLTPRPTLVQAQGPVQAKKEEAPKEKPPPEPAGLRDYLQTQCWTLTRVNAVKNTLDLHFSPDTSGPFPATPGMFGQLAAPASKKDADKMPAIKGPPGKFPLWRSGLSFDGLPLAREAKILIDGQERKAADLKAGMRLWLYLEKERLAVARVVAMTKVATQVFYILEGVDAKARTIAVVAGGNRFTLSVPEGASIYEEWTDYSGAKPDRRDLKLSDLTPLTALVLHLAVEEGRVVVKNIRATR
jgi:hypothetical protein